MLLEVLTMIISNLDAILKDRKLKISKVATDTGISRTTIASLCNNHGKGLQFDTANILCIYLNVSMGELFTTLPFDIFVENIEIAETLDVMNTKGVFEVVLKLKYLDRLRVEYPNLYATINLETTPYNEDTCIKINVDLPVKNFNTHGDNGNTEDENELLISVFQSMPETAIRIIKDRIGEAITDRSDVKNFYVNFSKTLIPRM